MQRSLTIALDMMGGDYGPRSSIPAAVEAVHLHPTLTLILCGNEQLLQEQLSQLDALQHPRLKIQHCTQIVTNADEPASALEGEESISEDSDDDSQAGPSSPGAFSLYAM